MDNNNIMENNNKNEVWEGNGDLFVEAMKEDINRIMIDKFGMNYNEFTQLKDKISNAKGIYASMSDKDRKNLKYLLTEMFNNDRIFTKRNYYEKIRNIEDKEGYKKNTLNKIERKIDEKKIKIEDNMKLFLDDLKQSFENNLIRYMDDKSSYPKDDKEKFFEILNKGKEIIEKNNNCWKKLDKNEDKIFEDIKVYRIKFARMKLSNNMLYHRKPYKNNLTSAKLLNLDNPSMSRTPFLDGLRGESTMSTPFLDGLRGESTTSTPLLDGLRGESTTSTPLEDALGRTSTSQASTSLTQQPDTYNNVTNRLKRKIESVDATGENLESRADLNETCQPQVKRNRIGN